MTRALVALLLAAVVMGVAVSAFAENGSIRPWTTGTSIRVLR